MKMRNDLTGDVLEIPPPNSIGESVILLNGKVIERVLYSDHDGGTATIGDGRVFGAGNDFADYIVSILARTEKPSEEPTHEP